ncbi:recombinase family protein [Enterobacter hormaechei]
MGAMCPQYLDVVAGADGRRIFVPNPEKVAIVQRIFRERAHTDISINQIAHNLNSEGVPVISHHLAKKGKPEGTAANISTLLNNTAVLGILRKSQNKGLNGQPKYFEEANYYPQVISLETWEAVQRESLSGKPISKQEFPAATNIFRGYIDCKHCNRRMTINGVRPDFPGSITCRSARTGLYDAPTFSMAKFEAAVIGYLFAKLSQVETSDGVDSNLQQAMIEREVAERKRDNFVAALADAESLVVINVITNNMEAKQRKVDILTERIEKLQRAVKTQTTQTKSSLAGLDLTVKTDREKARDIISEHIQQIVLDTKSRTVDVYLRNGNGIERFKLENPHDQSILLTEMLAPNECMLEISSLTGVSKVVALENSETSGAVDDRDFPDIERERSEFCVTLKILQRHHIIQPPVKING